MAIITRSSKGAPVSHAEMDANLVQFMGIHNLLHVQHSVAVGGAGGALTTGAWRTRPLTLAKTNNIVGASLASNQITLLAGKYYAESDATIYTTNYTISRLFNVTGALILLVGRVAVSGTIDGTTDALMLSGEFTLAAQSVVELQHYSFSTYAAGMGPAMSDIGQGSNIYANLKIWKLS